MTELNDLVAEKLRKAAPEIAELAIEVVQQAGSLPKTALEEQVGEMIRRAVREKGGRRDS
jgi:hypothetical protein